MLNGIIDSMRTQKVASSSRSHRSTFIPHDSEDRAEIKMLKESLRQRDKEMRQQNDF
jgi:hypothetical protein